jgi:hypothetical protein
MIVMMENNISIIHKQTLTLIVLIVQLSNYHLQSIILFILW